MSMTTTGKRKTIEHMNGVSNGDGNKKHDSGIMDPLEQLQKAPTLSTATLTEEQRLEKIADAYRTIIELVGEDKTRQGLLKTPMRAAKAMLHFTKGYEERLEDLVNDAIFDVDTDDLVIVRNIEISSLCEHHLVPFIGKCHIGYIPDGRVLGLSKLVRIAQMHSRRLQVQERLVKEIAQSVMDSVKPAGVAVVIEAQHMCMVMRGVEKSGSSTVSSCVLGTLREDPKTRAEFFSLLNTKTTS